MSRILDRNKFDVTEVTTLNKAFMSCTALETLKVDNWKTPKLTEVWSIFANCSSLKTLSGLENWEPAQISNLRQAFLGCSSLSDISAISQWKIKASDLAATFSGCTAMVNLDPIETWDTSGIDSLTDTFKNCSSLEELHAIEKWNVASIGTMYSTFEGCSNLRTLDLAEWKINKLTVESTFAGCGKLTELDLSGWLDVSGSRLAKVFQNCTNLRTIYANSLSPWRALDGSSSGEDNLFLGCTSLVGGKGTKYSDANFDLLWRSILCKSRWLCRRSRSLH